ncbi:MAG: beta-mannosidase [Marinilabiliales bacterium]|nr:MAG: beta-mannosidase [Marinilabiliales bacterium]
MLNGEFFIIWLFLKPKLMITLLRYTVTFCMAVLAAFSCKSPDPLDDLFVSNPNATQETRALYYNLKQMAGERMMFGHQDAVAYGIGHDHEVGGWDAEIDGEEFRSDVHDAIGSYPAVFGWDLGKIGRDQNIDSVSFDLMRQWMIEVYERGGINTVSWHEDNPATGGSAWDTSEAVRHILPGGERHEHFRSRLDLVADFFLNLRTSDGTPVPVVFRPYHEHTGGWFWWGTGPSSREEFIELWRFTHHYLTEERGCTNLLFSYSPDIFRTRERYMERFPGVEYVDVLGFDNYHDLRTEEGVPLAIDQMRIVVELAREMDKVAALTETGYNMILQADWWTRNILDPIKNDPVARHMAWVLVWRNENWMSEGSYVHHFAPYPGHPSVPDFKKFRDDPFTAFLEDLPDMYSVN